MIPATTEPPSAAWAGSPAGTTATRERRDRLASVPFRSEPVAVGEARAHCAAIVSLGVAQKIASRAAAARLTWEAVEALDDVAVEGRLPRRGNSHSTHNSEGEATVRSLTDSSTQLGDRWLVSPQSR